MPKGNGKRNKISKENLAFRAEKLHQLLLVNKTGNYSSGVLKLLAFIIITAGKNTVKVDYEDTWIKENFKIMNFRRCLGFLKQKDILISLISKEGFYKFNTRMIGKLLDKKLGIGAIKELDAHFQEQFEIQKGIRQAKIREKEDEFLQDVTEDDNKKGNTKSFIAGTARRVKGRKVRKDSTELYGEYRTNPSENPKLQTWQDREIDNWRSIDFLGYYICLYKEETGFENISLQNDQAYTKVKLQIKKLLDNWFRGKKKQLKKYIEWAVNYFVKSKGEDYAPSINTILNPYKTWPYDLFIKKKKKKKGTEEDKWADSSSWKKDKKK